MSIESVLSLTPPFADDFSPRVHEDLIVDFADAEKAQVILLHPLEARWALTNRTGLLMARAFDGSRSLRDVACELARLHGLSDDDAVLSDARSFAAELHRCNLLANAPLAGEIIPPAKPRIPSMTIYVTEQCNLRCKHCSIVEGKMPDTLLTGDDIRRLIDEHTTNFVNPTVAFLGGEPFMRPDMADLVEYAAARTRTVNMSTNGFFIDEALAQRLGAIAPLNLQVSLDGADPEVHDFIRGKGSFAKAWEAIQLLAKHGGAKRLTIAMTLTKAGLADVKKLLHMCDELGIGKIRFLPLDKSKAAARNWDRIAPAQELFEEITRYLIFDARFRPGAITEVAGAFPGFVPKPPPHGIHWCPLGETLIVNSQGETYNCPLGTGGDAPSIGNVYHKKLGEMLESDENKAARQKMLERRYAVEECRSCAWRNFCQGGCSAFIAHRSGSFYINDAACEFRRNLYREHVIRNIP
ncbi:radical SAM protein [Candidatus Sumerlaeota bacterium]|nr:radical SAM protein [Candidatus Sumerlaeota bacterium]